MTAEESAVVETLCAVIREKAQPRARGFSYRELDRQIGKEGQNWTSKFLKGPDARDFPGVPTLGTLLQLLRVLEVEPSDFFGRAFSEGMVRVRPQSQVEEAGATLERLEARVRRLEQVQYESDEHPTRRRRATDHRLSTEALEETVLRALRRIGIQPPEDESKKNAGGI
jgi:transcriptional regulator with XRE-family HTH domain